MKIRRDHAAGGAFVVAGALVLLVSRDYPFGTLASPGAGMLPVLLVSLMMAFGLVLFVRAAESPILATIDWSDLRHALTVVAVAAVSIGLYTRIGFLVTVPLMLFFFSYVVERQPLLWSLGFSLGAPALVYALFLWVLKTPLPQSPFGY